MPNSTNCSRSMNKRFFIAAVFAMLSSTASCLAQDHGPSQCSLLKPSGSSAGVFNAISDGRFRQLVACGLDPNASLPVAGTTMTPLQFAASTGRAALVRDVVAAGADPNNGGSGEDAMPPLEVALSTRRYEAAATLLALGARADYVMTGTKTTALMALAFDDRAGDERRRMAETLVQRGAAVNAADLKGNTPLHWAARSGNTAYAETLLRLGADACLSNLKGQRPSELVKADQPLRTSLRRACDSRASPSPGQRAVP
jgi:ankyrin repeat protein